MERAPRCSAVFGFALLPGKAPPVRNQTSKSSGWQSRSCSDGLDWTLGQKAILMADAHIGTSPFIFRFYDWPTRHGGTPKPTKEECLALHLPGAQGRLTAV